MGQAIQQEVSEHVSSKKNDVRLHTKKSQARVKIQALGTFYHADLGNHHTEIKGASISDDPSEDKLTYAEKKTSNKKALLKSQPSETKRIDYVLIHELKDGLPYSAKPKSRQEGKQLLEEEKQRDAFEKHLASEGFLVEKDTTQTHVYTKLHCPFARLAYEAERMRLEMPLKNMQLNPTGSNRCTSLFDQWLKTDNEVDYVSAPFEQSKIDKFENCESLSNFFRVAQRSLLVHSILTNADVAPVVEDAEKDGSKESEDFMQTKQGLPFLLMKRIYTDAYILHDECEQYGDLTTPHNDGKQKARTRKRTTFNSDGESADTADPYVGDTRKALNETWPLVHKYQPMWKIRNYFGEEIALYFAWTGLLTWSVFLPALFGLAIFAYGLWLSLTSESAATSSAGSSASTSTYITIVSNLSTLSLATSSADGTTVTSLQTTAPSVFTVIKGFGEDVLYTIKAALDNDITPWYSVIICVWGTIFLELWKRRNAVLAYEWDVDQYEANEVDRPEFIGTPRLDPITKELTMHYPANQRAAKYLISLGSIVLMVCMVLIVTVAVVVYRVILGVDYCLSGQWSSVTCTVVTSLCATVANAIAIMILSKLYALLAYKLTDWENHKTESEYKDALVVKLFVFLFANSYTSLYYIAFFRGNKSVYGDTGIFGLGQSYQEACSSGSQGDSCMSMLSLQVLVLIVLKPLASTIQEVAIPWLKKLYSRCRNKSLLDPEKDPLHPQVLFLESERLKLPLENFTLSEYADKVIQYGYLMLFAVSLPLAPLIVVLTNVIDRYANAKRMLWQYRRPVAFVAQDIGVWYYILDFLNICGVITNACLIAFTSTWGLTNLTTGCNQLVFILGFEHGVFALKYLIAILVPDIPGSVQQAIRREKYFVAKTMQSGKFARHVVDIQTEENQQVLNDAKPSRRKKRVTESTVSDETAVAEVRTPTLLPALPAIFPTKRMARHSLMTANMSSSEHE